MMLRMMILRRKTDPKTGDHTLCKPVQSKCTWTFDKSHFEREFTGKMPRAKTATHTLCEPAQSTCTWTFHRSHFFSEI